jgi:hypothetical protein
MKSQSTTAAVSQDRWICEETIRRIGHRDPHLANLMTEVLGKLPEGETPRYIQLSRRLTPDILEIFCSALEGVISEAARMNWRNHA